MKKNMQGFTLIELMIVVAIIAILAAIALPAYQDYVARAQVSEGMSLASGTKTAVTEFYADRGTFPTSNAGAGVATAASITGKYVQSVTVGTGGTITALITSTASASSKIQGGSLVLTPSDAGGSVKWTCSGTGKVTAKYLPSSCRP